MKRIKYRREYDVRVVEEYTADVPEHLLDEDDPNELDVHITSNFDPDHEDREAKDRDGLTMSFTVVGDVEEEQLSPHHFYTVGIVAPRPGESTDELVAYLQQAGCDYAGEDTGGAVIVSHGPFLSTSKNLLELAGDARRYLARATGRRVVEVLNATNAAGLVLDFTTRDRKADDAG